MTTRVDAQGAVVKLVTNGTQFPPATTKAVEPSLVSGMLLALVAAVQPTVKNGVAAALADSAVVSQTTTNESIGGVAVQSIEITVSSSAANGTSLKLSDFGPFTIATSYNAALKAGIQKSTAYFRMEDVQLR